LTKEGENSPQNTNGGNKKNVWKRERRPISKQCRHRCNWGLQRWEEVKGEVVLQTKNKTGERAKKKKWKDERT